MAVKHEILTKDGGVVAKWLTPTKAIREKCLNCCCWNVAEVRRCAAIDCPLWPYRMGKHPDKQSPATENDSGNSRGY